MASSYLTVKPIDKETSTFNCMLTIDSRALVVNSPLASLGVLGNVSVYVAATGEYLGSYTPASSPVSNTIIVPLNRALVLGERVDIRTGGGTPPVSNAHNEIWYVTKQAEEKNELVDAIKSLKPSVRILNVVGNGCSPFTHHGLYRVPKRSCY